SWWLALASLAVAFLASPGQAPSVPDEPTPEELKKAKDAFLRLGGDYYREIDPATERTEHSFYMTTNLKDADLKKIPDVPFPFTLYIHAAPQVSAGGLKALKGLKNLTGLDLSGPQVANHWLKELKNFHQ